MRAALRAAAVELLEDYAAAAALTLQIYPGRPRSIHPPTAFVDVMRETITYPGMTLLQRRPQADVVVLHGLFDSKDTADQADAFVDGFLAWVAARFHAAGANTLVALVSIDDDPTYVPDWQPPEVQRVYYATRITLEGYAENATV